MKTGHKLCKLNRRQILIGAGVAGAWSVVKSYCPASPAPPKAIIHEIRVISHQSGLYHGWPTVTRRKNGELLLVYSGGREEHVCPFGRLELMRSPDEGKTWGWPRVVWDSEIDDRDPGVLETAQGTVLVTTFTSLSYTQLLEKADAEKQKRWRLAQHRLNEHQRKKLLGVWMLRSTDEGLTWSAPYNCLVNSPHGPIQLADGRLLYAGKELWRSGRVGFCQSLDDGLSWQWLAELPVRPGDSAAGYHELHAVEAADGRIVAQIRNHNAQNRGEILQTESADGGKTWSIPKPIGVWGLPSHLLRLRDDRLLITYGYRRPPFGNQARLSEDHGRTWSRPMIISDDGDSTDLGYPSTVQLADGGLLTVWYEARKAVPHAVLRQAIWSLE